MKDDVAVAARTWNDPSLTLDDANRRIHDGVPLEQLQDRADGYVRTIFERFPYAAPPAGAHCLEIGSGVGWIMEALERHLASAPPASITGLDIAENMLALARGRLGGRPPFRFLHYDGRHVPLPDASLDFIYSVAALQHVPKPAVYGLFFEVKRLLRPTGFAVFHLLPWSVFAAQEKIWPWRNEVRQQLDRSTGHWHHFYSAEELDAVLRIGTGLGHVDVQADGSWSCIGAARP